LCEKVGAVTFSGAIVADESDKADLAALDGFDSSDLELSE